MTARNVAVVGTGLIGASWCARFLRSGYSVLAYDPSPDAEARLHGALAGWLTEPAVGGWRQRLRCVSSLSAALEDVEFVQENGPERLDLKQPLLAEIDQRCPATTPIASSSSGLMPSQLQTLTHRHPSRVMVGHPLNPPHLIPTLELVPGPATGDEDLGRARRFYESVGMVVIVPRKERPGHVMNRLQAALLREAFQLVADGVVTRDEIDVAVTHGLGLRWAEAGPFALSAIGGGTGGMRHMLDHLGPALNHWWASMGGFILDEAAKELLLAPSPVFHPAPTDPEPYRRFVQAMRTSLAQSSP